MMTAESYREFNQLGGIIDLKDRLVLRFTGADRTRYLNGQITANVQSLAVDRTVPACVTTAKGKLCGEGFVTNIGDAIWFDADPSLRESLPARFERYIISDDVVLEDLSDSMCLVHLLPGERTPFESLSTTGFGAIRSIPSTRFGRRGFDFLFTKERAENEVPILCPDCVRLSAEDIETLRIEQGIPRWGMELDENTLPPEAGLDRTHIDYQKGCYIGQEVISRLKSIGHVNRRLAGFVSCSGVPLSNGSQIVSAANPSGDECGRLTSAAWSFALEKPVALGYLRRSAPPGDYLARPAEQGAEPVPLTICELPFTK
jgi:folate-binding protein YgfZ